MEDVFADFEEDQLVGAEADAHGDGPLDPVHGEALVQALPHALVLQYVSKGAP